MTQIHQIIDTDETAEGFLRDLSGKPRPSPRASSRRTSRRPSTAGAPVSRPWLPASASLLVWGIGQWMNGQRSLAVMFLAFEGLAFSLTYFLAHTWEIWRRLGRVFFVDELHLQVAAFFAGATVPLLGMVCILQAHAYASRLARPCAYSGSAAVPCMTSVLIPGLGQILNDQIGKAGCFLACWSAGIYVLAISIRWPEFWAGFDRSGWVLQSPPLSAVTTGALLLAGLTWVVAPYDALLTARKGA
jgi:TM2 domain-containing membrane protein YozV